MTIKSLHPQKLAKASALILGGFLIFVAACSSSDSDEDNVATTTTQAAATTQAPTTTPTTTAPRTSYDVPGNMELFLPLDEDLEPGTIIDYELVDVGPDATVYRILYASRSIQDEVIAVSGYIATRSEPAPEGGWPLVAWAHGTVGMADQCAPSNDMDGQAALFTELLDEGFAVVATDYEGLGTPGLHPYIVGGSEARGVFDSVRAVQNHNGALEGISVSQKWVAWGHSQGGHAAMHVAQRWEEYAPELELVGVVAGAPPSQFGLLYNALLGGDFQGYIAMALGAFAEAYPDVVLEEFMADPALEFIDILDEGCTSEIFDAYNSLSAEELSRVENPLAVEPVKSIADENDPSNAPVQTPLLIIHGTADEQIPFASSLLLRVQLCGLDDSVPIKHMSYADETHGSVIPASLADMTSWMNSRFSGEEAESDC